MKRTAVFVVLSFLAAGILAESANALPRGTPIYRACMQDIADDFLYGGNTLFGDTTVHTAIAQAHAYCSRARVN